MSQSVVLLSDVPGLGQVGDVRQVKEGYARNYLIPQKLAIPAAPDALKRFERQKEKIAAERARQLGGAKDLAGKMGQVGLVYERPLGQGGRLFGSVTALDIISDLAKHGAHVEKRSVLIDGAIKTPGDHTVRVRIHSQVIVDIPVKVVGIDLNKKRDNEAADADADAEADGESVAVSSEGAPVAEPDGDAAED